MTSNLGKTKKAQALERGRKLTESRESAKKQRRLDEQTTEGGGSDAMDVDPAR